MQPKVGAVLLNVCVVVAGLFSMPALAQSTGGVASSSSASGGSSASGASAGAWGYTSSGQPCRIVDSAGEASSSGVQAGQGTVTGTLPGPAPSVSIQAGGGNVSGSISPGSAQGSASDCVVGSGRGTERR